MLSAKASSAFLALLAATGVWLCLNCSRGPLFSGGSSEIGNAKVSGVIVDSLGNPAPFTHVTMLCAGYNSGASDGSINTLSDTTDINGAYVFNTIDSGEYVIDAVQINDRTRGIAWKVHAGPDSIVTVPVVTLQRPGTIKVMLAKSVDMISGYFFVPGTDLLTHVYGSQGSVCIDSVPAGIVPAMDYGTVDNAPSGFRFDVPVASGDTTVVTNGAWKFCRQFYFNTTPSGAGTSGRVVNFPVLIRLTGAQFNFNEARQTGEDVRFTKPDNTPLSFQIERWDAANSEAEIWVKVDTVFGNTNTQYLVMQWGNPDSSGTSSGAAVFDTSNGFQGVWHLDDRDSTLCSDATANHFNGVRYGMPSASTVTGIAGNGQAFDGQSSYITISNSASGKLNFPENGIYTLSAWVYAGVLDNNYHFIVSKGNEQYGLQVDNSNSWMFFEFHGYQGWQVTMTAATLKAWKYIVGVRSGSRQYLYVDGIIADSTLTTTIDTLTYRVTSENLCIGSRYTAGNRWFNGVLDEVRIGNRPDSPDWIKLCYMNQRPDDKLVSFK
jgi:Domain of unknown function (DUF2341).